MNTPNSKLHSFHACMELKIRETGKIRGTCQNTLLSKQLQISITCVLKIYTIAGHQYNQNESHQIQSVANSYYYYDVFKTIYLIFLVTSRIHPSILIKTKTNCKRNTERQILLVNLKLSSVNYSLLPNYIINSLISEQNIPQKFKNQLVWYQHLRDTLYSILLFNILVYLSLLVILI